MHRMPLSLWEWQTYGYGWLPDWASDVGPHLANGLVDSAILDLASGRCSAPRRMVVEHVASSVRLENRHGQLGSPLLPFGVECDWCRSGFMVDQLDDLGEVSGYHGAGRSSELMAAGLCRTRPRRRGHGSVQQAAVNTPFAHPGLETVRVERAVQHRKNERASALFREPRSISRWIVACCQK